MILAAAFFCLINCGQPSAPTALENATGQELRIEVTYRGSDNRTVAVVIAGGRMTLQAPVDQIETVHYAYGGQSCALSHDQVVAASHPGKSGEKAVVQLQACY